MANEPVKDTDPTIGRLVSDASRDISSLVYKEIQLAKCELKVSVKNGGTGVGLFAGAVFFVLMGLVMFSIGPPTSSTGTARARPAMGVPARVRHLRAGRRAARLHRLPQGPARSAAPRGDRRRPRRPEAALKAALTARLSRGGRAQRAQSPVSTGGLAATPVGRRLGAPARPSARSPCRRRSATRRTPRPTTSPAEVTTGPPELPGRTLPRSESTSRMTAPSP